MEGRPAAHVARELGASRQCAYRWVRRYDAEGWADRRQRVSAALGDFEGYVGGLDGGDREHAWL